MPLGYIKRGDSNEGVHPPNEDVDSIFTEYLSMSGGILVLGSPGDMVSGEMRPRRDDDGRLIYKFTYISIYLYIYIYIYIFVQSVKRHESLG